MPAKAAHKTKSTQLAKVPTGIRGFDDITFGGLPKGRPTLVAGRAGSGKTLFAMEFLARGALQFNEPGVIMTFEETAEELIKNFTSLGFDIKDLIKRNLLAIDYVAVERAEIEETGEYDLDGLFIRIDHAVNTVKAKRIVLDTVETLFSGLRNEGILRAELRRLFRWIKDHNLTAVITGERGETTITRHGLEEYVADCVITLDHTVTERIATRRLRVIKYRGSFHGTDEYPFLITDQGLSVLPVTSATLAFEAPAERISSGIPRLDEMLGGMGYHRGSSVLVSGTPGTGKSTLAALFARAACDRGEKALYLAFEESPNQIIRNMRSVGIDLEPCIRSGLLEIDSRRPSMAGLELHLASINQILNDYNPSIVIADPISNLMAVGSSNEIRSMLTRLIDLIKSRGVTSLFTELISDADPQQTISIGVSSLMDTWVILQDLEVGGERNRSLFVRKSRGTAHSNQVREFHLTDQGVQIADVYSGPGGVLAGTARAALEAREEAARRLRARDRECASRELERKQQILDAQVSLLQNQFDAEREKLLREIEEGQRAEDDLIARRETITRLREARRESKRNAANNAGKRKKTK